ncbi:MAG: hypothetical protein P1U40_01210 [Coxiellaceae bacterium]|nr:hypothetical protein [Coxiellaceae bacterium]
MSQQQHLDLPLWVPFVAAAGISVLVVCVARTIRNCQNHEPLLPSFNCLPSPSSCCKFFSRGRRSELEMAPSSFGVDVYDLGEEVHREGVYRLMQGEQDNRDRFNRL